jgi:outer membrane protein OmpA-like peptidoglycan-associated protein
MSRSLTMLTAFCGLGLAACAKPAPQTAPAPPRADLVVLLPDPDDGRLGAATVTGAGGAAIDLARAGEGTRIVQGQPPSAPAAVPDADIQRIFGTAIAARPAAPQRFVLYFETGSDTLTTESQALVPQIIAEVRGRPVPDVTVIGHTDTTGEAAANIELGMRRATLIRDLLASGGLDPSQVELASHGEADLLVPTPDGTDEPKNRRVEVTVR